MQGTGARVMYESERGEDDEDPPLLETAADLIRHHSRLVSKASSPVKKKKRGKATIKVNLSACKYEVLRVVLKKLAWKEVNDDDADWQLYWTDTSVGLERVMRLKRTQKINHFCGMLEVCRKKKLSYNLARLERVAPADFQFHPQTFNLPDELESFMELFKTKKKKTYILKPDAGCQGKGIRLAQSSKDVQRVLEELGPTTNVVAQKYLARPFLIDGLKFDLRIYMLVVSCDPLRIYIFREGLARFCTEKYEAPKANNLATAYMHLTNYAVNKKNENFQFNTDEDADDEGSKWSLTALREWMEGEGHDYERVWQEICGIAVKTVISVQPLLRHNYRSVLGYENDGFSCFEILGMDVMLDSKLNPWLIECNHSPSFGIDTPLDLNIKEALISDTLKLARIDFRAIKKLKKEDKKAAESRLYGRAKGPNNARRALTAEEVEQMRASVLEKREAWEKDVLPGSQYDIIYPHRDPEIQKHYEHLLELSANLFEKSVPSRNNAAISAIASKKKAETEEEAAAAERRKLGLRPAAKERAAGSPAAGRQRSTNPDQLLLSALQGMASLHSTAAQEAQESLERQLRSMSAGSSEPPGSAASSSSAFGTVNRLWRSGSRRARCTPESREKPISDILYLEEAGEEEAEKPFAPEGGRGAVSQLSGRLERSRGSPSPGPEATSEWPASRARSTAAMPNTSPVRVAVGSRLLQEQLNFAPASPVFSRDRMQVDYKLQAQGQGILPGGDHSSIGCGELHSSPRAVTVQRSAVSTVHLPGSPKPQAARRQSDVAVPYAGALSPQQPSDPLSAAYLQHTSQIEQNSAHMPPVAGFPRRPSARVRSTCKKDLVRTGSTRSYSGVYTIIQGASQGMSEPISISPPADDMLDDYMQSYSIKRMWSGSQHPHDGVTPVSHAEERLQDTAAAVNQKHSCAAPVERRFSGLSIRGIRPT
mmetsp:Transcript_93/g.301  ORF Transcript_93/g.301 Transcript_93/m.301 type:complete len:938 (-) Transcript_93:1274-4087(-)